MKLKIRILFVFFQICITSVYCQDSESKKMQNALLINAHAGISTIGFSGKYIGSFKINKHPKYFIGVNASYEKIYGFIKGLIPNNVSTTINLGTLGVHVKYNISSQFDFQPEFSVLFGQQATSKILSRTTVNYQQGYQYVTTSYYQQDTKKNVIGAHFEQHLFYYPKKAKPLIIGLSIFEKAIEAEFYDQDFGACFYLGIKF